MSENQKYILVIDSGGTGIRAMLFNKEGAIVDREYEKTLPNFPEDGAIEHDPEVLWQALLSVVEKSSQNQNILPNKLHQSELLTKGPLLYCG